MFKKTKVRQILELLNKDLSAREIARVLSVSRNSVASVKEAYDKCGREWDEIATMNDDEIYSCFYPHSMNDWAEEPRQIPSWTGSSITHTKCHHQIIICGNYMILKKHKGL